MQFNSLAFLGFLPLVWLIWKWLPTTERKTMWLVLMSYVFYTWVQPWYGILLLVTTLIDWYAAIRIDTSTTPQKRRTWLMLSIITNLACLAGFKYTAFLWNGISDLMTAVQGTPDFKIQNWLIPAGLSFYTFQSMGYTIDVYRNQISAERNALQFALFVSFFPQLVAGPVERYSHLGNQLRVPKALTVETFAAAGRLMLWGFFKKIAIADRLALLVDPVFELPDQYSALTIVLTGFMFVVQVYCDFSGYSDIASGVARLFGVELMINWKRPLLSCSLQEFWKRNHISMTSWFRDYLYISLGGNRRSALRNRFNIFITFLLSGLWHGAGLTFIIWGALHGAFVLIEREIMRRRKRILNRWISMAGWFWLIGFHTLALLAFRANSIQDLQIIVNKLISTTWNPSVAFGELHRLHDSFPLLLALSLILILFVYELAQEKQWLRNRTYYASLIRPAFCISLFLLLFLVGEFGNKSFIYFQF